MMIIKQTTHILLVDMDANHWAESLLNLPSLPVHNKKVFV